MTCRLPGCLASMTIALVESRSAGLADLVIAGQHDGIERVRRLAAAGRQPQARWVADGYLTELARRVEVSERLAEALR